MADFIGISIEGDVEIARKLRKLASPEVIGRANKRIADHIKTQAMKYPARRSITRKQAYGKTFQSDRQRRWFFANLRSGALKIPYRRTGVLRRGWQVVPFGAQDFLVVNETPYGAKVMGANQARMMTLIGWKRIEDIATATQDPARRIMSEEIQREAGRIVYA